MTSLHGQVALRTGGGSGPGPALALELARRAMRVAIASRSPAHLNETAAEIRAAGGLSLAISVDVTSKDAVLADELPPHGLSVFAIQPGTVRTAMAESAIHSEAVPKNACRGWARFLQTDWMTLPSTEPVW